MDYSKITVIIGAGASSDFGFPINSQLKQFIINPEDYIDSLVKDIEHPNFGKPFEALSTLLRTGSQHILNFMSFDKTLDDDLINRLKKSGQSTIDKIWHQLFVENDLELASLLKLKVNLVLTLFTLSRKIYVVESWITKLVQKIGLDNFLKIKWINFNYDLTFEIDLVEHYIKTNPNRFYSNKPVSHQIRNLTRMINPIASMEIPDAGPIIEVLRPMGWLDPVILDYSDNFHERIHATNKSVDIGTLDFIRTLVENESYFKFLNERYGPHTIPNFKDKEKVKDAISLSDKIIFLGYGFNKENNEILSINIDKDVYPRSYGTGFKLKSIGDINKKGASLKDVKVLDFINDWDRNIM